MYEPYFILNDHQELIVEQLAGDADYTDCFSAER